MTTSTITQDAAFNLLHPTVRRWVWDQQWSALRANQIHAIDPIMTGERDVIISGATASGKTEAAWLPIFSVLAEDKDAGNDRPGVKVLAVSPLKALINDQARRLSTIGERLDIPVSRRHGDVRGAERNRLRTAPDGVLMVTPESLEALFVLNGPRIPAMFEGLRFIVVDELHAFIGTERGAQLQSLLHRIEIAIGQPVPRIALSATLPDATIAAGFLRPDDASGTRLINDPADQEGAVRLQLRGYIEPSEDSEEEDSVSVATATANHLFSVLRGRDNLVFTNSRRAVELYADQLRRRSDDIHVPNEFFAHHGSLSREIREDVEARLLSNEGPATAICTSTLELGIDIGSVDTVAQIGPPGSVSALRQRLGRSGRRGQPATLRLYITEPELDARSALPDQLRPALVESIATVELLLERWYEPPNTAGLHLSTLIQQILSVIAQFGGAKASTLHAILCGSGPFSEVTPAMFAQLLRDLGQHDLLVQESNGALLPGVHGEHLLNHYSFYTAFQTSDEYRLVSGGHTLGSLPVDWPVMPGSFLIFAGRRWEVVNVDTKDKVIDLIPARGGKAPRFSGIGPIIPDGIRRRMREIYERDDIPGFLDPTARQFLHEARTNYTRLALGRTPIVPSGNTTWLFPWIGDRAMNTQVLLFAYQGIKASLDGIALSLHDTTPEAILAASRSILAAPLPPPEKLAAAVTIKEQEKHDIYLGTQLLDLNWATHNLDLPGAVSALEEIVDSGLKLPG